MLVTAIVLAAGRGMRFKFKIAKPLFKLDTKPVIIYSLQVLSRHRQIGDIVLVVNAKNKKRILREVKRYRITKLAKTIEGGRRRQDSVANGLKAIDSRTDLVLIHDAARPFINAKMISSAVKEAAKSGAAITGVPVKATIKSARSSELRAQSYPVVEKTLDRKRLWEIQTPQVFCKDLILKAYRRFGNADVTDDAMLVENLGAKVRVVPGSYRNIKITTPEDLVIAQAILKGR
jgi:2-C-methyl-D-erythritol 4-phosphate cytidylyltransferase